MHNILPINDMTVSLNDIFISGKRFETKDAFIKNLKTHYKRNTDIYEIRMHRHIDRRSCITIADDTSFPILKMNKPKHLKDIDVKYPKTHNVILEFKGNRIKSWVKIKSESANDVIPLIKMIDYLNMNNKKEFTPYYRCKLTIMHNRGYMREYDIAADEGSNEIL